MTIEDIKTIGIIGAGQMGRGITQVLATAGWNVLLVDVTEEALEEATRKIWQGITKAVEKGALRGDQAGSAMAIIHPIRHMQRLREAQVVIEAIPEDPVMKRALFAQLGQICEPSTLLASNTSSISIAGLGTVSGRPDRVVGIHFMNHCAGDATRRGCPRHRHLRTDDAPRP